MILKTVLPREPIKERVYCNRAVSYTEARYKLDAVKQNYVFDAELTSIS